MLVVVAEGTKRKMQSAINAEFEGSAMYASMPTRDVKNNVWLESSGMQGGSHRQECFQAAYGRIARWQHSHDIKTLSSHRAVCVACTDC